MFPSSLYRPHTTVVLAMSADGKIADYKRSPARFGSATDRSHLEARIAEADGVLFGAGTLRAYGTTLPVLNPTLLQQRQERGKSPQPIHILCSQTGQVDRNLRFFRQSVPRWLLTTASGAIPWLENTLEQKPELSSETSFQQIVTAPAVANRLDWAIALPRLRNLGIERLVVTGGGNLVASLVEVGAVDEFWLTVCPILLGGQTAPTPFGGKGFGAAIAPQLELLSVKAIANEVFLHYRVVDRAVLAELPQPSKQACQDEPLSNSLKT